MSSTGFYDRLSYMDKYARAEAALKALKKKHTQAAIADALGIRPQAVGQWTVIPLNRLKMVCAKFGGTLQSYRPDAFE